MKSETDWYNVFNNCIVFQPAWEDFMAMTVWRCAYVKMTSRVTMSLGNVTVHQGSPAAAVRRVSMILSPDKCNRYQDGVTVVRAVWSCYLTVVRTLSIILSPDSYMDSKYDLVLWVVRIVCIILKCDSCQDSRYNFVTWQIDSCLDSKYDLVKLSGKSVWSCHVAVVRDWFCHMIL